MCVGYVYMRFQVSTCKGQRTVSGISPCLLPCLRQDLLIFFSAAYVSWLQSFSCLHLPPSCRSAIFLQERQHYRVHTIMHDYIWLLCGFLEFKLRSSHFCSPPRPSQHHLSCESPVGQLGTCKVQSQLNPSSALISLCCPWMSISRQELNAPCGRHLSELVLGLSCYGQIVFPKDTS